MSDDTIQRAKDALALLQAIHEDRSLLLDVPEPLRQELLVAAGQVSRPSRAKLNAMTKVRRRRETREARAKDEALLGETGIRALRKAPVYQPALTAPAPEDVEAPEELQRARRCYICKTPYTEVHFHYDAMCQACGDLNWQKRTQTADLRGRVALVTGGRVKIGFQAATLLLRCGARVIVTTRFPANAAGRFAAEPDFAEWSDRLEIHGIDLRHTPSVEAVCAQLLATHDRLDFLLNNACQTVRRPAGFYAHMMEDERTAGASLPAAARRLLASESSPAPDAPLVAGSPTDLTDAIANAPTLSQTPLLREDVGRDVQLFPVGELDLDQQQVDLRVHNSWRAELHEVSAVELLEVHLVNAVAPFILNARLKPLLAAVPTNDAHIVNVTAMEGQFYRRYKSHRHPHTNMAKAALNMMTRTAAADYVRDGIYMNAVDTGWVTDEDPAWLAERKRDVHRFHPPLDIVDGAARICDPFLVGVATGEHVWGRFLKDYREADW